MRPFAAIPLHDPTGLFFPHLRAIKVQMEDLFERVYVSIPQETRARQPDHIDWVKKDPFFKVIDIPAGVLIGDHFTRLYTMAAANTPPEQMIHLCYLDRVAFAMRTSYKEQFMLDVNAIATGDTPLLFMRSPLAWATHPQNYQEIEGMATRAGEMVFHKTLDFGWCHLVITAGQLKTTLKSVHNHDLSMVAEILIAVGDQVRVKEVDWLSWEDPFILDRKASELKKEREASLAEIHKRLSYVVPILNLIDKSAQKPQ